MFYASYRNRENGELITREQLRQLFSNTSFPPSPWPSFVYDHIGYDPIIDTTPPIIDDLHVAVENGIIQDENGNWTTNWMVKDKFDTEEEKNEYLAQKNNVELPNAWEMVRIQRNELLAETDYTQLSDTPISDANRMEFIEYRKLLRDITTQSDPYDLNWPDKPQHIKI
jgi:hypothetical protein